MKKLFLIVLVGIFLSFPAKAKEESDFSKKIVREWKKLSIKEKDHWTKLLYLSTRESHLRKNRKFYFSSPKNVTPFKEFAKSYEQFFLKKKQSSICLFPARFFWMKKKLSKDLTKDPSSICKGLQYNKTLEFNLVFASESYSFLTSKFGHIFLRINFPGRDLIKDKAIEFTARSNPERSQVSRIYNGLLTGLPGQITVKPYFNYIEKYLYEDSRTLWNYKLNLSAFQKELFYYHTSEIQNLTLPFLFLNKNCAFNGMRLLNVIYNQDLTSNLLLTTAPYEVIKILKEKKLLQYNFKSPPLKELINSKYRKLTSKQRELANKHLNYDTSRKISKLNKETRNFLFLYNFYLVKSKKKNFENLNEAYLTSTTSQTYVERHKNESADPSQRTSYKKINFGYYEYDSKSGLKLEISPAYKRFTDLSRGFNINYKFEVLKTSLLLKENPELDNFTFIDWDMLGKSGDFLPSYPFRVSSSVRKNYFEDRKDYFFTFKSGLGYGFDYSPYFKFSFMVDARYDELLNSNDKSDLNIGPRIFFRSVSDKFVLNIEGSEKFLSRTVNKSSTYFETSLSYYLEEDLGFVIKYLKWDGMGKSDQTELKFTQNF